MQKKKLLLHTCCAPCFAYIHQLLADEYKVISYFFNPNIAPLNEFRLRLQELAEYSKKVPFPLLVETGNTREWVTAVKQFRFSGERSERCNACFRYRLEKTFQKAREERCDSVGTVLSVSPHKDADAVNLIGKSLEEKYGIEFLDADFKKNDGYLHSVRLSKKYNFYRQGYCGCIYSKLEKQRASLWFRNTEQNRTRASIRV